VSPAVIIAFACSGESATDFAERDPSVTSRSNDDDSASGSEPEATPTSSAGPAVVAPNLGEPGNCCNAHEGKGCENEAVAECVCAEGSYCCNTAWDAACVHAVDELGCGICPILMIPESSGSAGAGGAPPAGEGGAPGSEPDPAPAPGAGQWSSCCEKQSHAGCGDVVVEDCVCYVDAYCCEKKWDRYCASEAETLGCAACSTFNGEGGAGGAPSSSAGQAGSN
jgi:hypothetical protein